MKHILILLIMAIMAPMAIGQSHKLTLKVKNIEEVIGQMCLAVYGSEDDYKDSKNQVWADCIPVNASSLELIIEDLPKGTYMISIFHDMDSNEELNTNWIGMPKEPFGFSKDAKGKMGPPKFEDASFELNGDMETTIHLMTL